MTRLLAVASLILATAPAAAAPGKNPGKTPVKTPVKTIVLQSEGRVDEQTRAKVDSALVRLASTASAQVSPGETTFADTATAVGCSPELPTCRDEVLAMLAVDELVYASLAPKPGGVEVTVYRVSRGATRTAKTFIATGASADDLGAVSSLFARTRTAPTPRAPAPTPTPPASASLAATASTTGSAAATTEPAATTTEPSPELTSLPPATEPAAPVVATAPLPAPTQPIDLGPSRTRTRLQLAGMGAGGAMVLVGFLLWGEAGTIQEEIDVHPTTTRDQLESLAELERRGDRYAAWGNVFFLGGAIVGGVSTYFYLKDRKARSAQTARIAPAVLGDGAGFTLTFGGSR